MKLFEIFGLDNGFPRPNENYGIESTYSTTGFSVDNITGEKKEGIRSYSLQFGKNQNYNKEYKEQVLAYVKEMRPDARPNANESAFGDLDPAYCYKLDQDYYGIVQGRDSDASMGLKGISIRKVVFESVTGTTPLPDKYEKHSPRIKSWTRTEKDGSETKWQYIRIKDEAGESYIFQYNSNLFPELPFDIDPEKTVTIDFDMIQGYTRIYYINKISIE